MLENGFQIASVQICFNIIKKMLEADFFIQEQKKASRIATAMIATVAITSRWR